MFLNQFGYREIHFLAFTKTYKITNVKALTKEFKEIQEKVYDAVFEYTNTDQELSQIEIKEFSENYLKENWNWIDQIGMDAINRWLIWMRWHGGILKT